MKSMQRGPKRALQGSKLQQIKEQIREGRYETREKLEIALIRMMNRVVQGMEEEEDSKEPQ